MHIEKFDLIVYFRGYTRHYYNISRVAVKTFLHYHDENPDFYGYVIDDAVA